jgi:predicted nucleotidyltransferase component of viral defense system
MTKPILTHPVENYYQKQVKLLLEILPEIDHYPCFALKGGTAINLFLRDFPRLSVDIDLTYLPLEPRGTFLNNLTNMLETLAQAIEKKSGNYRVMREYTKSENQLYRLRVTKDYVTIKIEPNLVLRGSVYPSKKLSICSTAQERFFTTLNINCLSFADIYAGKLCAALDRQHPRDLFDVKLLLENEEITSEIRQAFVVYVASSSRPIHELLNPNLLDVRHVFDNQFVGMAHISITYEALLAARQQLISTLQKDL